MINKETNPPAAARQPWQLVLDVARGRLLLGRACLQTAPWGTRGVPVSLKQLLLRHVRSAGFHFQWEGKLRLLLPKV